MAAPNLATCRYQRFHPTFGAAIRTTAGAPRWKLGYDIAEHWRLITPRREMLHLDRPSFTEAYTDLLVAVGVDRIRAESIEIADRHKATTLVLLCFEDLTKPELYCHRRLFADWWTQRTGEAVPEIGELRPADVKAPEPEREPEQLSLIQQARIQRAQVR